MKVVIDRFEGDFAVCEKEDRIMIDIPKNTLPVESKVGDVLIISEDNTISVDKSETEKRRNEVQKLIDELWE